jgi:K+-sensing histidine kinase KdpD
VQTFARDLVHELRTPLTALSGEVEVALRRERSAADYREALLRIAQSLSDLVSLTADLALLAEVTDITDIKARTASLDEILSSLVARHPQKDTNGVRVDATIEPASVVGDETLLVRGLALLVDHALRHRHTGATVRIRAARADGTVVEPGFVCLILDAEPPGFSVQPWRYFSADSGQAGPSRVPGGVRLRIAARIVERCGGYVVVQRSGDCDELAVCLRRAGRAGGDPAATRRGERPTADP